MAELALLEEDGWLAVPPGPGAFCSKAGETAIANIGHAASDQGPAVAGGACSGGTCCAPRDAGMVLTGSDPGGRDITDAAYAAETSRVARSAEDRAATPPEMPDARIRRTWKAAVKVLASARADHTSPAVVHHLLLLERPMAH